MLKEDVREMGLYVIAWMDKFKFTNQFNSTTIAIFHLDQEEKV